jgi:hypothetical protein
VSTGNIVSRIPTPEGLLVTFEVRGGQKITYLYDLVDGAQILAGEDPAQFEGVRV